MLSTGLDPMTFALSKQRATNLRYESSAQMGVDRASDVFDHVIAPWPLARAATMRLIACIIAAAI